MARRVAGGGESVVAVQMRGVVTNHRVAGGWARASWRARVGAGCVGGSGGDNGGRGRKGWPCLVEDTHTLAVRRAFE